MIKWLESHPIFAITAAVAVMLLLHLDVFHITIMEARNFITAREMVDNGNWLLTTMNGEARYEKPPLPTWLAAIFGSISGMKSLYALRLPGVMLVMLTGSMTYLLSKRLVNDTPHALVNGLIVITSFYVVGIIIEAPWDIFTHGFMLVCIYFLFEFFQGTQNLLKSVLLAGLFAGLSFMSKGPISLYALFLPFLIAYGLTYGYRNFDGKRWPLFLGILVFVVVGFWWFAYVRILDPISFGAVASRETSNWGNYNVKPFYHYWSFFIQSGIWTIPAIMGLIYPYMKTRVKDLKAYQFTILWTIVSIILLSLIPEKKNRYLMPVLIPLAMNTGFYIQFLIRKFSDLNYKERLPVYFHFGLVGLIGISIPFVGGLFFWQNLDGFQWQFIILGLVLCVIGVYILYALFSKNIRMALYLSVFFIVSALALGTPISKAFYQETFHPINHYSLMSQEVYYFEEIAPEFVWFHGKPIKKLAMDIKTGLSENNALNILVGSDHETGFQEYFKQNFVLLKVTSYNLNRMEKQRPRLIANLYELKRKK